MIHFAMFACALADTQGQDARETGVVEEVTCPDCRAALEGEPPSERQERERAAPVEHPMALFRQEIAACASPGSKLAHLEHCLEGYLSDRADLNPYLDGTARAISWERGREIRRATAYLHRCPECGRRRRQRGLCEWCHRRQVDEDRHGLGPNESPHDAGKWGP